MFVASVLSLDRVESLELFSVRHSLKDNTVPSLLKINDMKRRVDNNQEKRNNSTAQPLFSTWRIFYVVGFLIITTFFLAQQLSVSLKLSFASLWAMLLLVSTIFGILMLMSRFWLVMLSLTIIGFLLKDANGYSLWTWGAFFWLMAGAFSFIITLSVYAKHICPPLNVRQFGDNSFTVLQLLFKNSFRDWERWNWGNWGKPPAHIPRNLPDSFNTIRVGSLASHQVAAVSHRGRYAYAIGGGYSMLDRKHYITNLLDLRPQSHGSDVELTTRDGLKIKAKVGVSFQLRPNNRPKDDREPYSFDPEAVRSLVFADTVTAKEQAEPAQDRIAKRAVIYAMELFSLWSLDEILHVNDPDRKQLEEINREIKKRLDEEFRPKGFLINSASVGSIELPQKILENRLGQWEGTWKAPMSGGGGGTGIGLISDSEAKLQAEVLQEIMGSIEILRNNSDLPMRDEIADRLKQMLTEIAAEGMIRTLIPAPK